MIKKQKEDDKMSNLELLKKELQLLRQEQYDLEKSFQNKINSKNKLIKKYQDEMMLSDLSNLEHIQKELVLLEQENEQLIINLNDKVTLKTKQINQLSNQINEIETEMLKPYTTYFNRYQKRDCILVEDFPKKEVIASYYNSSLATHHPLWDYGFFDIRELAEIIRIIYSLERQKEYQILTFGYLEYLPVDNENYDFMPLPTLNFLIGDTEKLAPYQVSDGCFEEIPFIDISESKQPNLIKLSPKIALDNTLGIYCYCDYPGLFGNEYGINYWDYKNQEQNCGQYSNKINIFSDNMLEKLTSYEGIEDTLSFPVHIDDKFLATILTSIAIYKKNRGTVNLTNDDYRYIFQKIYGEYSINIEKGVEQNIPKQLKYVKTLL